MKLFLDFLPIILFFGVFKFADLNAEAAARFATEHLGFVVSGGVVGVDEAPVLLATVVVIVATLVQITVLVLMRRKVDTMLWVTLRPDRRARRRDGLVPQPDLHQVEAERARLGDGAGALAQPVGVRQEPAAGAGRRAARAAEARLAAAELAWIAFFVLMGVANLYVAYNFSTSVWATFKVFGADRPDAGRSCSRRASTSSRFLKDDEAPPEAPRTRPAAGDRAGLAMSVSAAEIEAALRAALAPEALAVVDDSHLHAGHAGAREGRHFSVTHRERALPRAQPGRPTSPRI